MPIREEVVVTEAPVSEATLVDSEFDVNILDVLVVVVVVVVELMDV